jgi:uncharacterized membrane protein YccC
VRRACLVLLVIVLATGCGGDNEPQSAPPTEPEQPGVDEQVRREVEDRSDRLAATMRRLATALDAADCDQAARIRRLRDRMLIQSRALTKSRADAAFRDDIADIHTAVGEIDTEIDGVLQDCRERRELERAADEAERLADEIEAEANQP